MRIRKMLLLVMTFILLFIFYWLFELQNGWPHNEKIFHKIQAVAIVGMLGTFALCLRPFSRLFMPLPLFIAFIVITLVSKSELNIYAVIANLTIVMFLFLIALIMRKASRRTHSPFERTSP